MKKLLLAKNNTMRRPEFRVSTAIFRLGDEVRVEKNAMCKEATSHLLRMKENYQKLVQSSSEVEYVPFKEEGNTLVFPYVEGRGLLEDIDVQRDSLDEIVLKLKDILFEVNEKEHYKREKFARSERFVEVFGEPNGLQDEPCSYPVNIDSILSNYLKSESKLIGIDYEWVVDFPVPIGFIDFRRLHYFYYENREKLKGKCEENDFLLQFGFSVADIEKYQKMEYNFQQYVHGDNIKYFYLPRFEKQRIDRSFVENLREQIGLKDNHINNITAQIELKDNHIHNLTEIIEAKETHINNLTGIIATNDNAIDELRNTVEILKGELQSRNLELVQRDDTIKKLEEIARERLDVIEEQRGYIEKLRRMLRNPFYALYVLIKKVWNKIRILFRKEETENKEIEEVEVDYYEKYKSLLHPEVEAYEEWITQIEEEYTCDEVFSYNPKISILVPVYNVLDKHLVPCIDSVLNQTYANWELCLADDNSTWENVRATLEKYRDNEKVKIVYRTENGHISRCTNSALEVATGEYVAFLDCDDVLAPNALYEMVKCLNDNPELDFIYSDEDKIDDDGNNRHMPHFKPDWSPDTFMSHMYTSHFSIYRRTIASEIGGLRAGYEGSQDYDFTLRFTEKTDRIAHIPKILYHWRERLESTAINPGAKPYILEAAKKSKEDALERRGLKAKLELVDTMYQFRVNYVSQKNPLVSIVIPSKDNYEVLKKCLSSLTEITRYKNYEIIVVDNGSSEENRAKYDSLITSIGGAYYYNPMDFNFSKMCNYGASASNGEMLLFLNDDIEIVEEEWLERMVGHAELDHVGAVGAKLLYPDGDTIQHVGVVSYADGPAHSFCGMSNKNVYYFGRNYLEYNWGAVTAACLLIEKKKFDCIQGFDETLAVTYNDVDLCYRLVEAGYYNVVRADAVLYHHESLSRGNDIEDPKKMERLVVERNKLYEKHPAFNRKDPFYNVNLAQNKIDFQNDYSKERMKHQKVENYSCENQIEQNLICKIDTLKDYDEVYIEGWAFISGRSDNNDLSTSIVLIGQEQSYIVSTERVYRKDVSDAFGTERNIEFVGYKTLFEKKGILPGEYVVGVQLGNWWKESEQKVIIGS